MRLTATVVLRRPSDSELVVLTAGQQLPDWATDLVTTPGLLAGGTPDEDEAPRASDDTTDEQDETSQTAPVVDEVAGDELVAGPEVQTRQDTPPAEDEDTAPVEDEETPSEEWTLRRLREYATTHDVDLGDARTKAEVLQVLTQ